MLTPQKDSQRAIAPLGPDSRGHLEDTTRWTLCIGAGVSQGIVPLWEDLTIKVVNRVFDSHYDKTSFRAAVAASRWGLDSWIQAAANEHRRKTENRGSFSVILQQELYGDLLRLAEGDGVRRDVFHALQSFHWDAVTEANTVCEFFNRHYKHTSLMRLVDWLLLAERAGKMPFAIISFNVEPLFHMVFNCFQRQAYGDDYPKFHLERVTKPNFVRSDPPFRPGNSRTVFVYHCHGSQIPHVHGSRGSVPMTGVGNAVFLEEDYLDISGHAATWPETLFMYHANFSRMVFVGLSMSDPNIRHWLGLSHQQTDAGKVLRGGRKQPPHLWIEKSPNAEMRRVLEAGLSHLGVTPAWIPNWEVVGDAMKNLTDCGAPIRPRSTAGRAKRRVG
ncbi:MAG: SIR2 family protein [Opitutaceae bacterium]|jgi:hypothetical protein